MDRLAYKVLAGPGVRLALRRLAPDPDRRTSAPELRRTAAQAEACCAALAAR
jgi:hypothetical protein